MAPGLLQAFRVTTRQGRPPGRLPELCREIVRYLLANPEAKDSVRGIHRWWIPDGGSHWTAVEVEAALDFLVEAGHVVAVTIFHQTVYGLAPGHSAEIEALLDGDGFS